MNSDSPQRSPHWFPNPKSETRRKIFISRLGCYSVSRERLCFGFTKLGIKTKYFTEDPRWATAAFMRGWSSTQRKISASRWLALFIAMGWWAAFLWVINHRPGISPYQPMWWVGLYSPSIPSTTTHHDNCSGVSSGLLPLVRYSLFLTSTNQSRNNHRMRVVDLSFENSISKTTRSVQCDGAMVPFMKHTHTTHKSS